jgi:hypothetical protein
VLEADVTLVSGALTGAGLTINSDPGGVYSEYSVVFATDPDTNGSVIGAGTTGRLYKFRKLVQITRGDTYTNIFAMSHYSSHGSIAAANSITWHRCAVRAASQAEIEARQAKNDLVTTNANVATNTSAIATESSARAAADTVLTASVTSIRGSSDAVALPSTFEKDDLYWTQVGGSFVNVSTIGRVYQATAFAHSVRSLGRIQLRASRTYRFTARYRVETNSTSGDNPKPLAGFTFYNSAGANISAIWVGSFFSRTVSDGWVTVTGDYTTATILGVDATAVAIDAYCQPNWHDTGAPNAVCQVQFVKLEDVTDAAVLTASVSTNASAIATVNGAAAFWETIVSAGGGDLAAVRLKAGASGSYIELISTVLRLANVSNGAVIEVMRAISGEAYFSRPISSDSGARRVTIGPGYGVSGQEVVLWFGPVGTAPSGQSRTNGYFALGTDGKVYYGASELGAPVPQLSLDTVGLQVDLQTWPTDAQVNFTLTASGGKTPYTYAATKLSASGFAFSSSGLVSDDFEAVMTGTSGTTRNGSETWLFSVTDDDGTVVSTVGQISLTVFG